MTRGDKAASGLPPDGGGPLAVRPADGRDGDGRGEGGTTGLTLTDEQAFTGHRADGSGTAGVPLPAPAGGGSPAPEVQALDVACRAMALALAPSQAERLMAYLALLQRWNRVYNLTAVRDGGDMLRQHLFDCLAVLPALRARLAGGPGAVMAQGQEGDSPAPVVIAQSQCPAVRILDVGSGGGLPGVVLAIMQPDWQVQCVDTVAKKASFIRQVAAELPVPNLLGQHARVETLRANIPAAGFTVVTARAFASLADFTRLTRHLLAPHGCWMAMKGRMPDDEIAQLPSDVEVFHVEHLRVPGLDAQRCLVWMRPRAAPTV